MRERERERDRERQRERKISCIMQLTKKQAFPDFNSCSLHILVTFPNLHSFSKKSTYINIHTIDEKAAITIILKIVIVVIDTFNCMAYQGNIRRNNRVFMRERQTDMYRQCKTDREVRTFYL